MNKTNYGPRIKLKSLVAAITLMVTPGLFVPPADAKMPGYYQQKPVTGKVTDEKGEGIGAVSVTVMGTNRGALTNPDGSFSINATTGETLIFSIVGFKKYTVAVGAESNISVSLIADASALADVVVVGYGTQKRVTVTGAVAQVKGSELQKAPVFNLSNALVGRLPGITAVQSSGEPGYDGSSIRIRGTNAFGNNNPLVVIDGVPERAGGLERLNPADIETVSVLKDASAAIYGQRAANGVILITTKRGKSGKPTLSYDFNQGWAQATRIPKMMNVNQYGEVRNEIAVFEGVPAV
jgi:TonB-dependent SusC/RagA subfamily outer membrane receptor